MRRLLLVFSLLLFACTSAEKQPAQTGERETAHTTTTIQPSPALSPWTADLALVMEWVEALAVNEWYAALETTTTTVMATATTRPVVEPVGDCYGHGQQVRARWPAHEIATACRIIGCESGGSATARNPRSSASGTWQFLSQTWRRWGDQRYASAADAPVSVQHDAAFRLWLVSYWHPWECW